MSISETSDEQTNGAAIETETAYAVNLIRELAIRGLSKPTSLEPEEIAQLCLAVLSQINNSGMIDL